MRDLLFKIKRAFSYGGLRVVAFRTWMTLHRRRQARREEKRLAGLMAVSKRGAYTTKAVTVFILAGGDPTAFVDTAESVRSSGYRHLTVKEVDSGENEYEALYKAVKEDTSPYFMVLFKGDRLKKGCIDILIDLAVRENAPFTYSDMLFGGEGGESERNNAGEYSPDTLSSYNYIGNACFIGRKLFEKLEFDENRAVVSDARGLVYDILRKALPLGKKEKKKNTVCYAPIPLLQSEKSKEEIFFSETHIQDGLIEPDTKVSVIIPSRDHPELLRKCLESLVEKNPLTAYELIVVDNGSKNENKCRYERLCDKYGAKYIYATAPFNFSAMCNKGCSQATGDYLLFLNDDTEFVTPSAIRKLAKSAEISYHGAVGAKLLYPSGKIQHIGVVGGLTPVHLMNGEEDKEDKWKRKTLPYNYDLVTGACLMIKASVFDEVKGFYEGLPVSYNDLDLCMKLREAGYFNMVRTDVVLIHYESETRGTDEETPEKIRAKIRDVKCLARRHREL